MSTSTQRPSARGPGRSKPVDFESLERLTSALMGATARALAASPEAGDLTLTQWRTLIMVVGHEGMHIGDVATRLGVSMPSASRFVRRLEQRDLAGTNRDPNDRRAVVVRATPRGIEVAEDVIRNRRLLVIEALAMAPELPPVTDLVLDALATALSGFA